jgi:hypothetical protein
MERCSKPEDFGGGLLSTDSPQRKYNTQKNPINQSTPRMAVRVGLGVLL